MTLPGEQIEYSTLVDVLEHHAKTDANKVVYEFFSESGDPECITNGQLAQRARSIAVTLKNNGVKAGDRVLLVYPPGIDLITAFFGCFYAGAIAVLVYPPTNAKLVQKIKYIIEDAEPVLILTTNEIIKKINLARRIKKLTKVPLLKTMVEHYWKKQVALTEWNFEKLRWINTDSISDLESTWHNMKMNENDIAFLQYTSGSTSQPKGVMVSHGNLMHNLDVMTKIFNMRENCRMVFWLPPYHDMGLIGGILSSVFTNSQSSLISPVSFIKNPIAWLQLISDKKATHSGAPNFFLDYCVDKIDISNNLNLDLSSLEVICDGAEPVRNDTINRFYEAFKRYGLRKGVVNPCYGLAESTLVVSGNKSLTDYNVIYVSATELKKNCLKLVSSDDKDAQPFVSCGDFSFHDVQIVNPDKQVVCQPNEIGEIWVRSKSVTQGYWRKPNETAEIFHAKRRYSLENKNYLRTGDLGFILDNNIYITGRIKDLIIIHGKNYYPQDIEYTADHCHSCIQPGNCIALSITADQEEKLVLVCGVSKGKTIDYTQLRGVLSAKIYEEHQIVVHSIYFVSSKSIPKTTSGKLQRRLCKEMLLNHTLPVLNQWQAPAYLNNAITPVDNDNNKIEPWIQQWIANHAGMARLDISTTRPFVEYGLDSIAMIQLLHDLSEKLHQQLDINLCWEYPSPKKLADFLTGEGSQLPSLIKLKKVKRNYLLSFGQERLWFLHLLSPKATHYNIGAAFRINGYLNIESLQKACDFIVQKHTVLRSTIHMKSNTPAVDIKKEINSKISIIETGDIESTLIDETNKPYDLANGPLIRFVLLKISNDKSIFLCATHHIIFDGWSVNIFMSELMEYYHVYEQHKVPKVEPLVQFSDYSAWERKEVHADKYQSVLKYWIEKLKDANKVIELPTDHPRQAVVDIAIRRKKTILDNTLSNELKGFCRQHGMTPFVFFMTAFQLLLYRYSNQENFIIGVPVAGRTLPQLRNVIGYFVNTLPISLLVNPKETVLKLLIDNYKIINDAYAHQEIILPELLKHLNINREISREPLMQVMFIMQNSKPLNKVNTKDLSVTPYWHEAGQPPYDIVLEVVPMDETFQVCFSYNATLFDESTIERFLKNYLHISQILKNSLGKYIYEMQLLSDQECKIISSWNHEKKYNTETTLHYLFEQQVEKTPDNVAVIFLDKELSYRQVNILANQLAHYLIASGVKPKSFVATYFKRSEYNVVALLAILKAGAIYVPVDNEFPKERVNYILSDINTKILLTDELLSSIEWILPLQKTHNPNIAVLPENIAYVIYTSGSTGKPKGVMVRHNGVINCFAATNDVLHIKDSNKIFSVASVSFDVSIFDAFVALLQGAAVVIADNQACKDPKVMLSLIQKHKPSLLSATPSILKTLLMLDLDENFNINWLSSGEALPSNLAMELLQYGELYNFYGPTENSIAATAIKIDEPKNITIGLPLTNVFAYILDKNKNPCPIGVPGELHLGGAQVSAGYLNMYSLTTERFTSDPFIPGKKMYKTGDICRRLLNGQIEYLGRIDHQVKIHGCRIELGEIENVLKENSSVQNAVVMAKQHDFDSKVLVAYIVPKMKLSKNKINDEIVFLRKMLASCLPAYMIPSAFVFLDEIPINANGKSDVIALENINIDENTYKLDHIAPRTPIESKLIEIWGEVLKVDSKKLGIEDNFFELGGDSILIMQLCIVAEKSELYFNVQDVFKNQTIAKLAQVINANMQQVMNRQDSGDILLSPIQTWFFEQHLAQPEQWNQTIMLRMPDTINVSALEASLKAIFEHHSAFAIRFANNNKSWQQSYNELSPFELKKHIILDAENYAAKLHQYSNELQAQINLDKGPLYQVALIEGAPDGDLRLLITIHHLIVDGVSWRILLNELAEGYSQACRGATIHLPVEKNTYKDWVLQLSTYANSEILPSEKIYWLSIFSSEEVPVDNPHYMNTISHADTLTLTLSEKDTAFLLKEAQLNHETNILNTLLTSLLLAYHDWHEGNELLLDVESHGREELFTGLDIKNTIGWFTAMFPVLLKLPKDYQDHQLSNLLTTIDKQLAEIPHKGIGYGLMRYLSKSLSVREKLINRATAKILFNYLGQVNTHEDPDELFKITNELNGFNSSQKNQRSHLIEINSIVLNKQLTIKLTYCKEAYYYKNIESFLKYFEKSLLKIKNQYLHKTSNLSPHLKTDNIIKLNDGDAKHAIFCVHPIGGNIVSYAKLANMLAPHFAIYGIEAPGLHDDDLQFNKIEEMARYYLLQTKKIQPEGPYALLGWSMGGLIALEMANQLKEFGDEISLLGLLDAQDNKVFPPIEKINVKFIINYILDTIAETSSDRNQPLTKHIKSLSFLVKMLPYDALIVPILLKFYLKKVPGIESKEIAKHLSYLRHDLTTLEPTQLPIKVWYNYLVYNHILKNITLDQFIHFYEVYRHNFYATLSYQVKDYESKIIFFDSTNQTIANHSEGMFANVNKVHVPGTHFDMMRNEAALRIIREKILSALYEENPD